MRADRLLSIMLLLRAHRRLTAADLAARLEVTERTILRDMAALSTSGVPVLAERGRHGGFSLLPGFRVDVSDLDDTEAQVLFASLGLASLSELGLDREIGSTLAKLSSRAPGRATDRLREVIHRDRRPWFAATQPEETTSDARFLPELRRAAAERRRVVIGYRSPRRDTASRRTLDPIGLVENSGHWYLLARHRGRSISYRTSRITSVQVLDTTVVAPVEPLAEIWQQVRSRFEVRKPPDTLVTLAVDVDREQDLRTAIQGLLADGQVLETIERTAERVVLRGLHRIAGPVVGVTLAFGGAVRIVDPPALQERADHAARSFLRRQASADTCSSQCRTEPE